MSAPPSSFLRCHTVAALALLLGACTPEEIPPPRDDDGNGGSACGEPTFGIELDITGRVVRPNGKGAAEAEVALEDRSIRPFEVLGTATTGPSGTFTMAATGITSFPDCWLTVLDYQLVAELPGQYGERKVNRYMWEVIQDDIYELDITAFPVELEALE